MGWSAFYNVMLQQKDGAVVHLLVNPDEVQDLKTNGEVAPNNFLKTIEKTGCPEAITLGSNTKTKGSGDKPTLHKTIILKHHTGNREHK